jgi:hypothetical protein
MRYTFFLLLMCNVLAGFTQDTEYTDARNTRESFSRLYDKDIKGDLASFTIAGIAESINKPVLKVLPVTKYGDDYIKYDSNNLQVIIKAGVFNIIKHKLHFEGKYLVRIDNKPYFGNYTKVPQVGIAAVTVVSGKDTIAIPPAAFADLYNPHFTYTDASGIIKSQDAVYISGDKRKIYIYMLNRDDKGSYEVTWIIQDNKYLRRVIDFGFTK